MKTYTHYPKCERHKLLRTLYSGVVVVSSAALHDHLGERYQEFIETVVLAHEPNMGFWPETVEAFLANGK